MDSFFEFLPLLVITTIPIIAIVGGITHGIIKSIHKQRLLELAHKERIAALEAGKSLDELPPLIQPVAFNGQSDGPNTEKRQLVRSQRFLLWGMITVAVGVAATIGIAADTSADPGAIFAGLWLGLVGIVLVITARIVRPDPEDVKREKELRERIMLRAVGELPKD